jgi:mannan endo-1,4-beta-mannosidase
VTFSVSETGINGDDPNVTALWYASTLGEFARQGVEIFTPWGWKTGMYEVIHMFSRYGREYFVDALSSEEEFVSAYPTIDATGDTMSIFLVNRHLNESRQMEIDLLNFHINNGAYKMFTLTDLPAGETFVSHGENALTETAVEVTDNILSLTLSPLSVNVIFLDRAENEMLPGDLVAESEAEDGELSGVIVESVNPGYSGRGYVTGLDDTGDELSVSIEVPERGLYKLLIRYNGPNGDKYQDLKINNGSWSKVRFPATDSFMDLNAGTYLLEAGENSFTIRSSWGWTDIDKFQIYPAARNSYNIAPLPVDTAATEATRALYDFLVSQFGKRIISGQTHSYYTPLSSLTGKAPMVRAGDFQYFTEGYPYLWVDGGHTFGKSDDGSVSALTDWYNSTGKTGIVSYQWHWHSPSGGSAGTNTFYTDYTTFDITRAVTAGTQEYQDIIRDIDDISTELKKFQDAGIPVLWRPLHEAGGGWFWWGAKGPEACKELYNIMFDRMKNHHRLHNLLWVWSSPEESWYPGNDKVDIIGHDSYPGDYNYGPQKNSFDVLYRLTGGEKLIAMTENGPIPDPDECFVQDSPWSYFMSWSNLVVEQNTGDHIREVFDHPKVITVGSDNIHTGNEWRSSLYPENWKPGYKDASGRYLHDFSYAGYHKGEKEVPEINTNVVDVTLAPYLADNTGTEDVTAIIQQALDDVGTAGGGVVYLPAGTYLIRTPEGSDHGLRIRYDSTVLRGKDADSTFLFHDGTYMRQKDIILVMQDWAGWFNEQGTTAYLSANLPEPTNILPVVSVAGFNPGDLVVVASSATDEFIEEHKMAGIWTASAIKGVAFLRQIDSIDAVNNLLVLDAPTRYFLKTRDNARVYHAGNHISECGIEHLSIGNLENPKSGWDEESYTSAGTGAYDVHFSHVIRFNYSQNCWMKNLSTYKPDDNTQDVHILSNGIQLNQSRFITVDSCFFQKPQYEGGGGNGYMFTLQSNDCLIKNSRANHSRHNYDFKYPFSSGNVIHNCLGENSKYASDFHMYLSMSNLFDAFTVNGDYLESNFRPWGGNAIHGYSSTQSVFYNTDGEAYHPSRDYIIESRQFGWGYIIGTSGPAYDVVVDPASGSTGGYTYDTSPRDFKEGIAEGEDLRPSSLYLDQLDRRMKDKVRRYDVNILVKDEETDGILPGCQVSLFGETKVTDASGTASFSDMYSSFILGVEAAIYPPLKAKQVVIYSDTTLTVYLRKAEVDVTFKLLDINTGETFWGARVTFNDENGVTDTAGEAEFRTIAGTYNYAIDKLYYRQETGTVSVQSDTTLYFYLTRTHADIKFWLKEGIAPVDNALVMVNGDSLTTATLGMALFRELPVSANYHYQVIKEGYAGKEGDIYLTTDTTLQISMDANTSGKEIIPAGSKILCWPNPAKDFVNFSIPGNYSDPLIRITDIVGNEIERIIIYDDFYRMDVKDLPPGMYLLEIMGSEIRTIGRFIKN